MQEDRSKRLGVQPLIDVELAMSTGEEQTNGFRENHKHPENVLSMRPEFRTEVAVAGVTVAGVLPGTARLPAGSIAICGDVQRLSCDRALELADVLMLVVMRMDVVAEERYGATCDRRD